MSGPGGYFSQAEAGSIWIAPQPEIPVSGIFCARHSMSICRTYATYPEDPCGHTARASAPHFLLVPEGEHMNGRLITFDAIQSEVACVPEADDQLAHLAPPTVCRPISGLLSSNGTCRSIPCAARRTA